MLKDMVTDITTDSNADIFITGDFNIDYNKPNHLKRQELKNWETSQGLKQYISDITRFSDSPSTIDLIFSNSDDISHSGVLHLNISDHEATYFVRKKITPKFKRVTSKGRSYLNYDRDKFVKKLLASDWSGFDKLTDPNEAWQYMLEIIINAIDRQCPIK